MCQCLCVLLGLFLGYAQGLTLGALTRLRERFLLSGGGGLFLGLCLGLPLGTFALAGLGQGQRLLLGCRGGLFVGQAHGLLFLRRALLFQFFELLLPCGLLGQFAGICLGLGLRHAVQPFLHHVGLALRCGLIGLQLGLFRLRQLQCLGLLRGALTGKRLLFLLLCRRCFGVGLQRGLGLLSGM